MSPQPEFSKLPPPNEVREAATRFLPRSVEIGEVDSPLA
jgi:hypothetical protein